MRKIRVLFLWLRNVFNIEKPNFLILNYAKYIIHDNGYLVFNWSVENAYILKIKSAKYQSFLKSGSAYIATDSNTNLVEIIISSSWRSTKHSLNLQLVSINKPIVFPATLKKHFEAKLTIPDVKQKHLKLQINPFKISCLQRTELKKIINISYPN